MINVATSRIDSPEIRIAFSAAMTVAWAPASAWSACASSSEPSHWCETQSEIDSTEWRSSLGSLRLIISFRSRSQCPKLALESGPIKGRNILILEL